MKTSFSRVSARCQCSHFLNLKLVLLLHVPVFTLSLSFFQSQTTTMRDRKNLFSFDINLSSWIKIQIYFFTTHFPILISMLIHFMCYNLLLPQILFLHVAPVLFMLRPISFPLNAPSGVNIVQVTVN